MAIGIGVGIPFTTKTGGALSLITTFGGMYFPDGMIIGETTNYGIVDATGAISQFTDGTGNLRNGTQGTGANQAVLVSGVAGNRGRKIARFDGVNDEYTVANAANFTNNISGFTYFVVAKVGAIPLLNIAFYFSTNVSGTSRIDLRTVAVTGEWRVAGRRLDGDSVQTVTGNASNSAFKVICGRIDYANSNAYIYENGVLIATNTAFSTDGNTSATNSAAVYLGSTNGSNFFNGDIGLILVKNTLMTEADAITQMGNINAYFGLY